MTNIGVIGCGYWGPNLIRNFFQMPEAEMKIAADLSQDRLKYLQSLYPGLSITTDYMDIIDNPEIDAVAIATPVFTHRRFVMEALAKGKHVFVEKPMASSLKDARDMIALAEKMQKRLMVGHTFEYHAAVRKIKEIIDSGELGDVYYINSQRLNLGLFQKDINVVWDLAPHDISIILYLLGKEPEEIVTTGTCHVNPEIQDVATVSMTFKDNIIAFIQCSWLDPNKVRKMTIVGSKKMLVYDDIQQNEKLWIFDKGVDVPSHYDTFADFQYSYRYGDITIPKIDNYEPLKFELQHFVECIENGGTPQTDGQNGLRVVKILEAAQHSIDNGGKRIRFDMD